jgi:hypothetical protein
MCLFIFLVVMMFLYNKYEHVDMLQSPMLPFCLPFTIINSNSTGTQDPVLDITAMEKNKQPPERSCPSCNCKASKAHCVDI